MIDYSKWSDQAIFNKIAKHLVKQNKRSKFLRLYDDNGCRCAIGSLVSLKEHKRKGIFFSDILNNVTGIYYYYNKRVELLRDLRWVHDDKKIRISRWPQRLRAIARKYNLEIPEFLK